MTNVVMRGDGIARAIACGVMSADAVIPVCEVMDEQKRTLSLLGCSLVNCCQRVK